MRPFATGEITPDAFKALLLQLDPQDDEAEQSIRMGVEADAERRIGRALNGQRRILVERIQEYDNPADWMRLDLEITLQAVRNDLALQAAIQRALTLGVDLGVSVSLSQLERIGLGFDYTLVHGDARNWAAQYGYGLIRDINGTSERLLRQAITQWIESGLPLSDLRQSLIPVFGERRASLIAATEVTRAYAQGTVAGYRATGVVGQVEWRTSNDERVCPVCGPRHGQRAPLADSRIDGYTIPAHPGCRCWWAAVVD